MALRECDLSEPNIPLYSNFTAEPYGDNPTYLLSQQICSPVKWEALIKNMIAQGCDTFIELGVGNTLVGLINRIDKSVRTFCVTDKAGLDKLLDSRSEQTL